MLLENVGGVVAAEVTETVHGIRIDVLRAVIHKDRDVRGDLVVADRGGSGLVKLVVQLLLDVLAHQCAQVSEGVLRGNIREAADRLSCIANALQICILIGKEELILSLQIVVEDGLAVSILLVEHTQRSVHVLLGVVRDGGGPSFIGGLTDRAEVNGLRDESQHHDESLLTLLGVDLLFKALQRLVQLLLVGSVGGGDAYLQDVAENGEGLEYLEGGHVDLFGNIDLHAVLSEDLADRVKRAVDAFLELLVFHIQLQERSEGEHDCKQDQEKADPDACDGGVLCRKI